MRAKYFSVKLRQIRETLDLTQDELIKELQLEKRSIGSRKASRLFESFSALGALRTFKTNGLARGRATRRRVAPL
jgi:hypothetical protein